MGKIWKGKKRLAYKMLGPKRRRKLLEWATDVKPGDYIGTCEGCNRKVTEVRPVWRNEGDWRRGRPNKTKFVHEVRFTDTNGRWHYCPGGGCAYPRETPERVTEYFRHITGPNGFSEAMEKDWGWYEQFEKIRAAFSEGRPIVDADGELLPEFDFIPVKT